MNYMGASINTSSVVVESAGVVIKEGAFCAVKYDSNGNVVLCNTAGELVTGILLAETSETVFEKESVTVQIKDIGLCKAGAKVQKGQEVMTNATGKVIPATTGKFVIGYAMTGAEAEGDVIEVDIRKSGYKA